MVSGIKFPDLFIFCSDNIVTSGIQRLWLKLAMWKLNYKLVANNSVEEANNCSKHFYEYSCRPKACKQVIPSNEQLSQIKLALVESGNDKLNDGLSMMN